MKTAALFAWILQEISRQNPVDEAQKHRVTMKKETDRDGKKADIVSSSHLSGENIQFHRQNG